MKSELLSNEYVEIFFDKESAIYECKYLPETENLTDKEWKELMVEFKNLIEKFRPKYIIDDNRKRGYSYSPDMQEWMIKLFVPSWNKIGVKKYVQIIPDIISGKLTAMQLEELADLKFETNFEYRMMEDIESAYRWIEEDK